MNLVSVTRKTSDAISAELGKYHNPLDVKRFKEAPAPNAKVGEQKDPLAAYHQAAVKPEKVTFPPEENLGNERQGVGENSRQPQKEQIERRNAISQDDPTLEELGLK